MPNRDPQPRGMPPLILTPNDNPSMVEFQPQCVKKAPTAGCDRMRTCGAHPRTKNPLPFTLFSKPSSASHLSISFALLPPFTTKINGNPNSSKPRASSIN
ncbi:hypothetical protein OSB04_010086 [Centaurea solstitialis]|uniref:Uncharacterized protein n=1 Tax=Centaurea solstitialis TaxID=347529 RepID=A0AA38WBK1_9ASTR|nr:hypothetical protein OSB04_010086 [Centaurea solstitialis]